MPSYYLDTSAVVKRYLREIGSAWVDQLCTTESIVLSSLSRVELASVLARQQREGRVTPDEADVISRQYLADAESCLSLRLTNTILQAAANLLQSSHSAVALRTLDALHVASARSLAIHVGRREAVDVIFVSCDRILIRAAQWAGFSVVNPEEVG